MNAQYFKAFNWFLCFFTVVILACIFLLPFLKIDQYFNFSLGLSLAPFYRVWNGALYSALWNSIKLSLLASVFAVIFGSIISRFLSGKPLYYFLPLIFTYSINPVLRALTYFNLVHFYTPIESWLGLIIDSGFTSNILLPAFILALHYLPLYLMRNFFVLPKKEEVRKYPGILEFIFVDVPIWFEALPISFTLFFLMSFFDYWVIQVVSSNTVLYWTPLFIEKAFQARAVSEASFMILIGLIVTLAVYLLIFFFTRLTLYLHSFLSPLSFAKVSFKDSLFQKIYLFSSYVAAFLIFFPILGSLIEVVHFFSVGGDWSLMPGTARGIISGFSLSVLVGAVSATVALIISFFYEERPSEHRFWRWAYYCLALAPEAAFILLSFFVTGSGLIRANFIWLAFLLSTFSIPTAFFLWESLWSEGEKLKLWVLGSGARNNLISNTKLALLEWRKYWSVIFLIIFWLTSDNVFTTNFAGGPKWKPFSAAIFNATKRGFSGGELLSSIIGALIMFAFVFLILYLLNKAPSSE